MAFNPNCLTPKQSPIVSGTALWYTLLSSMEQRLHSNKHEAVKSLDAGIASGDYRQCAHLKIAQVDKFGETRWLHVCQENSFMTLEGRFGYEGTKQFCPDDCVFFVDRTKAIQQRQLETRRDVARGRMRQLAVAVLSLIRWPFEWFAKLPGVTQALLILLVIFWLFPKLADSIVKILQAVK